MIKSKKIRKLAKKAGFIFWDKESTWGPGIKHIDWSCDYDKEFNKFVELLLNKIVDISDNIVEEIDPDDCGDAVLIESHMVKIITKLGFEFRFDNDSNMETVVKFPLKQSKVNDE